MRAAAVVGMLLILLLIAGLPGLAGLAPRVENAPWGVTTYEFAYTADIGNFGTAPARNVTARIALLRDFAPFQRVERMDVLVPGSTIDTDDLGNRYAVYAVGELAAGASVVLNFTARVQVFGIDFALNGDRFAPTTSVDPRYVAPEAYVESTDPRLLNASRALRANASDPADYAYRAYVWTTQHLTYETQPQERGALWALKTGRGMCYEYANLYLGLLRAQGIPAKRVNGWGDRFEAGDILWAEAIAHAWALVDTEEHGWLPVDPTFGDRHLYENFMKANDMHVILTEGVNRHFYRVAYDRGTGVNVQVDYTVHVLAKQETNLSLGRQLVFAGVLAVPILLTAAIAAQVLRERRKRVFED